MASTYSSSLRLELITTGEQANTWGITTNTNLGTLIEQAISGYSTVNMASDADRTLTTANGSSDESRPAALKITSSGSLTATRNIIVPTVNKLYSIKNATTGAQSILVKTSGGTGITIPNGETATVICDGTNVVYAFTAAGMGISMAVAASAVTNTPAGNIAATNVQAALNELDTEKAKLGTNGDITSLTACTAITAGTVTVATGDLVYVQDVSAANVLKVVTAQSIANLAPTSTFPSGTRMTFNQTAAPTGWTKDTTAGLDDSIMRIVTGTVGSGGSTAFSTFNGQTATGAYALALADIPAHDHEGTWYDMVYTAGTLNGGSFTMNTSAITNRQLSLGTAAISGTHKVASNGGGGTHSHTMTTAIKYNDFIIASKD
jgi:hypothetical protein